MKKAVLAGLLAFASSMVMQGAACSNTTLSALNGMGSGVGCTYDGFTFSNFYVSGYNDFGFSGFSGLTIAPSLGGYSNQTGQTNLSNWLVNFSGSAATGVTVTLTTNQNGWFINLPFGASNSAQLSFEVKYIVAPPQPIQSITASDTLSYQVTGSQPTSAQETLLKSSGSPSLTSTFLQTQVAGSANNTSIVSSKSFNPNNVGGQTEITDNSTMVMVNDTAPTGSQSFGVTAISNTFSLVPEPMTLSMMGAGLVGLALLRRRSAKK